MASLILSNELGATDTALNAFSRTSSESGNDTVRELAKATLASLGPAATPALDTLITYERGRTGRRGAASGIARAAGHGSACG